jgi:hypothetical protein
VPLITPALESVNPEGSVEPEAKAQVYEPEPPEAARVAWYAAVCVACGRVANVVTVSAVGAIPLPLRLTPLSGTLA